MKQFTTLLLYALLLCCFASAQNTQQPQIYLQQNHATWNNGFNNAENVFTKSILQNQLFLVGEGHGTQYNHELQFDLIKHLQQTVGLKYILLELGFLDQLYLNRYLQTGNEQVLDSFFQFHPNTFYYNKQLFQFFQKLYNYNLQLPAKNKLQIITVDLDFAYRDALLYVQRNLPAALPDTLKHYFTTMLPKQDTAALLMQKFNNAYSSFINNGRIYKKHLGKDFEDTKHLLNNINHRLQIAVSKRNDLRDSLMYQNFLYAKKRYGIKDEKIIGLMGSFHVKQFDAPGDPRFAAILVKTNAVKGVVSLMSIYNAGEAMIPNRNNKADSSSKIPAYINLKVSNGSLSGPVNNYNLMEPYFNSSKAVLFLLNKKESPFHQSNAFTLGEDPETATITQLIQVLILFNQSPATVPYRE
ncbi:MAG: erythromycin esterase family protein [Chitinophagaceae bacterium]|nr:erythromycin esterase family protein [Chitinophagaceae bacterium]